ncbi:hypothetical protein CF54_02880, partial [Streptomyces sp. Tu 6176]
GSDLPHTPHPTREPALVGTAPHTATETAVHTGNHLHLGNSLDTHLGDLGRTGDDLAPPHHGDTTPDHTPGGHAGDHMPRNELDNPLHNGHDHTPATGGGHHPENSSASEHSGGSGGSDGHGTGGGHHEPPSTGDLHPTGPGHDAFDHSGAADENGARDAGHHTDEAARHRAEYEAAREKPADERTAEERAAVTREHVRLFNEDPAWRAQYYDKWGPGKRNNVEQLVDGQELPQVVETPNGDWIAKHDLPSGPSEVKFNPDHLGPHTAPDHARPYLDEAARNRRLSVDLLNAEKKFETAPTPVHEAELAKAQATYDEHLKDVPNNSKHSERLGEASARHHVIPQKFPGAERIELPKTPNGANMFDDVYKLGDDGHYVIVEEKAPSGDLDWRQGKADPDPTDPSAHDGGAQGMRVKQGTRPYIRTILAEMTSRGGRDAQIAADLRAALKDGKVQYVLVKASDNPGYSYAGATIEHLKI